MAAIVGLFAEKTLDEQTASHRPTASSKMRLYLQSKAGSRCEPRCPPEALRDPYSAFLKFLSQILPLDLRRPQRAFLTAVRFGRFKDFKEPLGADQKTQRGGQNAILVYIAHILQLQHPPHICT